MNCTNCQAKLPKTARFCPECGTPVPAGSGATGGDRIEGGDKITVGRLTGNTGVAIGRNASVSVTSGLSGADVEALFRPLVAAVNQAPPEKQPEAQEKVEALKSEVAKGEKASDERMAKLVDGLVGLVPGAVSAVASLFASPILAGIAGPVTKFVLDKIQGK